MKIAYILNEDISNPNSGVVQKINMQKNAWEKEGCEVQVISILSENNESSVPGGLVLGIKQKLNPLKAIKQYKGTVVELDAVLQKLQPDIIYTRFFYYIPNIEKVFNKHAPYVVEINSNDIEESIKVGKLKYYYNVLTRGSFLNQATGFCFVTHELEQSTIFKKYKKHSIVISNSIDFKIDDTDKASENITKINIGFIGAPNLDWHGIDKILYLSEKLPEYDFHIIGPDKQELKNIPKNMKVYGFLKPNEAFKILCKCQVAISTMALHRKNMDEACSLKTRQYLSLGLPVILGYNDTDLMHENYDFILKLPNTENNIQQNVKEIKAFIVNSTKLDKKQIQETAQSMFSISKKEKERIAFLKKLSGN